jgi:alpha-1,3-rhamnosyl/mannosyltransferase
MVSRLGYDASRVRVIPAWLTDEFSEAAAQVRAAAVRQRYDLPDRYWLYVGGYDIRKNVDMLIRVYASVRRRNSAVPPLVLAGRIPLDLSKPVCRVRQTVALELPAESGAISFPGFIDEADLPGLYAAAELFVYPSLYEGFGLPPMEAMGCGSPAIVADNTSLREVVTDADYRFGTASPEPLAKLLERACAAPLPLNPSFRREAFDKATAAAAYGDLFSAEAERTCHAC